MSGGGFVSGRFQVVLSDLESMAGAFRRESRTIEAIMPDNGPPCPYGGGADIDAAMHAALLLLGVLHQRLAAVIGVHGRNLQAAHDNYEKTETSLTQMAAELIISGMF